MTFNAESVFRNNTALLDDPQKWPNGWNMTFASRRWIDFRQGKETHEIKKSFFVNERKWSWAKRETYLKMDQSESDSEVNQRKTINDVVEINIAQI